MANGLEPAEEPASRPERNRLDRNRWFRALQARLYDNLSREDAVQPADLIFVLAGRMARKRYGLQLYQAGYAPRLLLSVGRFEVSKMRSLQLERSRELEALRDQLLPENRHFFVHIDPSGTRIEIPNLLRWNTYGEAVALRQFLEGGQAASVLVISSRFHLRRVAWIFRHVFRSLPFRFHYCPVPEHMDSIQSQTWWTNRAERRLVLSEYLKLAAYGVLLQAPAWAVRRAMSWKP